MRILYKGEVISLFANISCETSANWLDSLLRSSSTAAVTSERISSGFCGYVSVSLRGIEFCRLWSWTHVALLWRLIRVR